MVTPAALQRFQSRSITSMLGSAAGTTWATTFLFTKSSGHLVLACSRGILMPRKSSKVLSRSLHRPQRSEEHTSELQSLMRISYAVFCLKQKKHKCTHDHQHSLNTSSQ